MQSEFGKQRVVDTPIAEEGFVGLATGAAMLGLRPVVEIMTINFILVAIDQIVNNASKIHYMFGGQARVPLVIRTPSGGVGQLAATHSQSFENWFAYCPDLKVVAPATPYDAKGMLSLALRGSDPVIFFESQRLYSETETIVVGGVPIEYYEVPLGEPAIRRVGQDVTIITIGATLYVALAAAQELEQ